MKTEKDQITAPAELEVPEYCSVDFPLALYKYDLAKKWIPLHWHEKLEIGFVAEGMVIMRAGREKVVLHAGDGFFVNSCIPHYYKSATPETLAELQSARAAVLSGEAEEAPAAPAENWNADYRDPTKLYDAPVKISNACSYYALVLDPIIVGGRIDSVFWNKLVQPVLSSTSVPFLYLDQNIQWKNELLQYIKKACLICEEHPDGYEIEVRYNLSHAMHIIEQHLPIEQAAKSGRIARDNERILIMMNYIQLHFGEELSDADIAASATISVSECLRCFNNTLGITPNRYVNYYRVQHAAEQLRTTERPVTDIAEECGFQDMSYFARAFKQRMNVTPREYRKQFN